uniref:Uncharacterized protein n=1 Tax=Anopheles quadriannulatus TaxID=34691 RepID=A0A182XT21_ANOQN
MKINSKKHKIVMFLNTDIEKRILSSY